MFIKSFSLKNYRKFYKDFHKINFVDSKDMAQDEDYSVNIAEITTLIVGKNNSGKTTMLNALITLSEGGKFCSDDFNYTYLYDILKAFRKKSQYPVLEFEMMIGIEDTDLVTNIYPFITVGLVEQKELLVKIKYEIEETGLFKQNVNTLISGYSNFDRRFRKFLNLIDETSFKITYFNSNNEVVNDFKLSNLMNICKIEANNIKDGNSLSRSFNNIIKYRYNNDEMQKNKFESTIEKQNRKITKDIDSNYVKDINKIVEKIVPKDKLEVFLQSDVTYEKLFSSLIRYEYKEGRFYIPETQFGLGYANIINIVATILDHIDHYNDDTADSKINLITIEEPETYMHPQMQEIFIKRINEVVEEILTGTNKHIKSQIIITTHSSHILNSKIHTGNSFNNINYITQHDKMSEIINLNDETLKTKMNDDDLNFLKKHIKYKVSELFFSDAVILVEGDAENTLLPFYIDQDDDLKNYYISVFNIGGAHGYVYKNLLHVLKVPAVIITDVDIKRKGNDKEILTQIENKEYTNDTLFEFVKVLHGIKEDDNKRSKEKIKNKGKVETKNMRSLETLYEYKDGMQFDNIFVTYQYLIKGCYATSFEEAFIRTNYDNKIVNDVLEKLHPIKYNQITEDGKDISRNLEHSFQWQTTLSNSKTKFANLILYKSINDIDNVPRLPEYILNGFKFIKKRLGVLNDVSIEGVETKTDERTTDSEPIAG